MNKKLPSVFQNKINGSIDHNNKIYYSKAHDDKKKNIEKKYDNEIDIRKKINKIFNENTYIYKIDVLIKLKDKEIKKRIIGRNKRNLITMDNEIIPISEIMDIICKPIN